MSHRSNPPCQSANQRARKPIMHHNETSSVGHNFGTGSGRRRNITLNKARRPQILDSQNGELGNGTGAAPGAVGVPLANTGGKSSW